MATSITSDDDLRIYENETPFKIYAGPGAGKTHLLIENIKAIIMNSPKIKNKKRKILCITYTNAGADEIKRRLGKYGQYAYVSTIHSFLYDMVIKSNQKQLKHLIKEKYDIDLGERIKFQPRAEGFPLLANTKKEDLIEFLISQTDNKDKQAAFAELSKKTMENVILDISAINAYPFNECPVNIKHNTKMTDCDAKIIKQAIWQIGKVLDFDEILYFSYLLLKNYRYIVFMLQSQFPYIFIDEFQDTNPIQNKIIKTFADVNSCTMGVVGDIVQSIYKFQGATYKEFEQFDTSSRHKVEYVITGNRRSSKNIVNFISYLRKNDANLERQECTVNITPTAKVKLILRQDNNADLLPLIPNDAVILCRADANKFRYIRNVDNLQAEVLQKVSDKYKYVYGRELSTEIDKNRTEWIRLCNFVVSIKDTLNTHNLGNALNICSKVLDVEQIYKESEEQGHTLNKFILFINKFNGILDTSTFAEIRSNINTWLTDLGLNYAPFEFPEIIDDDDVLLKVDTLQYKTIYAMIKDIFSATSKVMTIHKAKGLEFEKVFVDTEPFSTEKKKEINTYGILLNPQVFSDEADKDDLHEFTRVLYVAASRAENELLFLVECPKNMTSAQAKTNIETSLNTYMSANGITEPFYEIETV